MAAPIEDDAPKSAVPLADVSELDRALKMPDAELGVCVKRMRPADVGRDLSRRTRDAAARILTLSDERYAAAALRAAHHGVAAQVLAMLPPERAARILAYLPTEPRTAILQGMEARDRLRLEEGLAPEDKAFHERTLALPEGSVGRLMSPRFWSAEKAETVSQAAQRLREQGARIEVAANLYVTDGGKLAGVLALREVLGLALSAAAEDAHGPHTLLGDVMVASPMAVKPDTDRTSAAEIIQTHDFLSLPVVDDAGILVGVVRVDDLLDAALERGGIGLLNQGAVAGKVAARLPYFQISLHKVVRSRVTWLVLLFVAETLTGTVLRLFEDELARVVALSFFIPLLIGTGGNAGSQTISTVIRALALGEVRPADVLRVLGKETTTGVILGVLLGLVAYFRALLWGVGSDIALCVAITILAVCTWANLVGGLIPIAAQKLKIDPTVVSGPLITTLVDASGLFIYLSIAKLTVSALG